MAANIAGDSTRSQPTAARRQRHSQTVRSATAGSSASHSGLSSTRFVMSASHERGCGGEAAAAAAGHIHRLCHRRTGGRSMGLGSSRSSAAAMAVRSSMVLTRKVEPPPASATARKVAASTASRD